MTNSEIILRESVRLVEEGVLSMVGEMPEPIHTYATWKALGFQVKKGVKSSIKFPIWKYTRKKIEENGEEKEKPSMFLKTAAFFTMAEVEPITQKA